MEKPKITLKKNYRLIISNDDLLDKLRKTEEKLKIIEEKYKTLKENPQILINNNNNVFINFPLPFGKEEIKYINNKIGDVIGPLIKKHPNNSIPALFQKIHNNEQLPEYHNVYTSSERSNMALVSDGKNFIFRPKNTVIDEIIEEKRYLINSYIDDNGDKLGKNILDKYDKYQNLLDENDEFRKNMEIEIGAMLLNMKSVIANDDKLRKLIEKVNNDTQNN